MPEESISKKQLIKEIVNKIWTADHSILTGTEYETTLSNEEVNKLRAKLMLLGTSYEAEVIKIIEHINQHGLSGVELSYVKQAIDT